MYNISRQNERISEASFSLLSSTVIRQILHFQSNILDYSIYRNDYLDSLFPCSAKSRSTTETLGANKAFRPFVNREEIVQLYNISRHGNIAVSGVSSK